MRRVILGAALAACALAATPALAGTWQTAASDLGSIYGVEVDTIRIGDPARRATVVRVYRTTTAGRNWSYDYAVMNMSFDCKAHTFAVLTLDTYMLDGRWTGVGLGTAAQKVGLAEAALERMVCGGVRKTGSAQNAAEFARLARGAAPVAPQQPPTK